MVELRADGGQQHVASLFDSLKHEDASFASSEILSVTVSAGLAGSHLGAGLHERVAGSALERGEHVRAGRIRRASGHSLRGGLLGLSGRLLLLVASGGEGALVLLQERHQRAASLLLLLLLGRRHVERAAEAGRRHCNNNHTGRRGEERKESAGAGRWAMTDAQRHSVCLSVCLPLLSAPLHSPVATQSASSRMMDTAAVQTQRHDILDAVSTAAMHGGPVGRRGRGRGRPATAESRRRRRRRRQRTICHSPLMVDVVIAGSNGGVSARTNVRGAL